MSSYRGNSSRRGYSGSNSHTSTRENTRRFNSNRTANGGSTYRQGESKPVRSRFQDHRVTEQPSNSYTRPSSSASSEDRYYQHPRAGAPPSRFDRQSSSAPRSSFREYRDSTYYKDDYAQSSSTYRNRERTPTDHNNGRAYKKPRFDPNSKPVPVEPRSASTRAQLKLPSKPARKFDIYSSTLAFRNLKQCGEGTYGKVFKVENLNRYNTTKNNLVAMKRLRLENEKDGFPITSIREIKLLQRMSTKQNNQNISILNEMLVLKEESLDPNIPTKNTINMMFDYCQMDLFSFLEKSQVALTFGNIKTIGKQLLSGMDFLHSNNIIHRDIKPSNILINSDGIIKITDFGLARIVSTQHLVDEKSSVNGLLTNRVITLWYRPIELLLGSTNYSFEVDMWGCGCLLLQLINKKAPFQGMSDLQTLYDIIFKLGVPSPANFPKLFQYPWTFLMLSKLCNPKKYNLKYDEHENIFGKLIDNGETELLEVMKGLLTYDPLQRMTAKQSLNYNCFKDSTQLEDLNITQDQEYHEYEVKKERRENRKLAGKSR